ncbi:unnamed protein product [Alternaria alternata]
MTSSESSSLPMETHLKVERLRQELSNLKHEIAVYGDRSQYNPVVYTETSAVDLELMDHLDASFIAAGFHPTLLLTPWVLTPAKLDNIFRIYYGLAPHDPAIAACSFLSYFASINGRANGFAIGTTVNELHVYCQAANQDEVIKMLDAINRPDVFGENGTGIEAHAEEDMQYQLKVTLSLGQAH